MTKACEHCGQTPINYGIGYFQGVTCRVVRHPENYGCKFDGASFPEDDWNKGVFDREVKRK